MLICQCCFAIVKVLLKKVTYLLSASFIKSPPEDYIALRRPIYRMQQKNHQLTSSIFFE